MDIKRLIELSLNVNNITDEELNEVKAMSRKYSYFFMPRLILTKNQIKQENLSESYALKKYGCLMPSAEVFRMNIRDELSSINLKKTKKYSLTYQINKYSLTYQTLQTDKKHEHKKTKKS